MYTIKCFYIIKKPPYRLSLLKVSTSPFLRLCKTNIIEANPEYPESAWNDSRLSACIASPFMEILRQDVPVEVEMIPSPFFWILIVIVVFLSLNLI